ncbi:hypothetical protein L3Q82_005663 [Scortum barcoo]|uniref:Uncharacterized protein n=1 Tax=Scortum barcoo TaxID=214431 RepID=A0ACB8V6M8_9TELE|nr:hypothetical protein L3Q82_005663 [Scortum barcoo]
MIGGLAALIVLSTASLNQTAEVSHQISLTVVEVGWKCYFALSSFREGQQNEAHHLLTIRNVSKEDEATYFCLNVGSYSQSFGKGVFLAVKDRNQQKSVIVKQSPETASVQPGGSVTLQCSLLSKNKENRDPVSRNSSDEEEERSCVYSLSKTIQNSSDTGTYYCAVATCGEILFGEGTTVETSCVYNYEESSKNRMNYNNSADLLTVDLVPSSGSEFKMFAAL